jgi:hypothetical protein
VTVVKKYMVVSIRYQHTLLITYNCINMHKQTHPHHTYKHACHCMLVHVTGYAMLYHLYTHTYYVAMPSIVTHRNELSAYCFMFSSSKQNATTHTSRLITLIMLFPTLTWALNPVDDNTHAMHWINSCSTSTIHGSLRWIGVHRNILEWITPNDRYLVNASNCLLACYRNSAPCSISVTNVKKLSMTKIELANSSIVVIFWIRA